MEEPKDQLWIVLLLWVQTKFTPIMYSTEKNSSSPQRKIFLFSSEREGENNQKLRDFWNKMTSRIRFLHLRTHFLGCRYSGKTQTKPRTFFGLASAQQRIHMFDFNFTVCQLDSPSLKTKLNPQLRSASKAAAMGTKARTARPKHRREGHCWRSHLPPCKEEETGQLSAPLYKDTGKQNSPSLYAENLFKGSPALLHKTSTS